MKQGEQSLFLVAGVIAVVHAAVIYGAALRSEPLYFRPAEKRLVVNTVATQAPKVVESKPAPPKPLPPKPSPPKPVAKKPLPKKPASVAKKDPAAERKQQLIANAQAKIAQIRNNLDKSPSATAPLKDLGVIESLRIDSPDIVAAADKGYYGLLAGRLRARLRLPEYGEVRVRLTLSRAGAVVQVDTVGAASEYNRQYVEKMLPSVVFPPFGKNFGSESQHTFTITLTNDA